MRGGFLLPSMLMMVWLVGCSSGRFVAPLAIPDDRQPIPEPGAHPSSLAADFIKRQFIDQIQQSLDLSRQLRNLTGCKKEAFDVDAFDEVVDSSWFTNRNHLDPMPPEQIRTGPNRRQQGPDTSRFWTIISAKSEGVTPGFAIKDSQGGRYFLKFDPCQYTELASGAELVSTKLFYAAGYNVPENYIVYFDPRMLRIAAGLQFVDANGQKRDFRESDIRDLLQNVATLPDGRIRAMASKFIEADKILGPFSYQGRCPTDANDLIPHQHRRELRGLRVIAAWLNHFDTKANNTLDAYVEGDYVRHYLIDFGSTLGSNGDEPQPRWIGHENDFDPEQVAVNIASLGLYVRPWEGEPEPTYPSIGYFESADFQPQHYKFIYANPAFELLTDRDGFWGAKIVMSFSDEQLAAAVGEGQYSKPEASRYLLKTLIERRDIVGRYWFDRVNPIDHFEVVESGQSLHFTDLAVATGIDTSATARYRYEIKCDGKLIERQRDLEGSTVITLASLYRGYAAERLGRQWEIGVSKYRVQRRNWMKPVRVFLAWNPERGQFAVIGLKR